VYKCWSDWSGQMSQALRQRGRGDLERGLGLIRKEV